MNPPTVTMHQPAQDNRPPAPETATLFVVVYAHWHVSELGRKWFVHGNDEFTREKAEQAAQRFRERGDCVYGIAEITARQEPNT